MTLEKRSKLRLNDAFARLLGKSQHFSKFVLRSVFHFEVSPVMRLMEESRKNIYTPPVTEVIEIKQGSVICVSGEIPVFEHGWDLDFNQ